MIFNHYKNSILRNVSLIALATTLMADPASATFRNRGGSEEIDADTRSAAASAQLAEEVVSLSASDVRAAMATDADHPMFQPDSKIKITNFAQPLAPLYSPFSKARRV